MMGRMAFSLAIAALTTSAPFLTGCAVNFGADRMVTRVRVFSDPPGIAYTLLNQSLAEKALRRDKGRWVVANAAALQQLVDEALPGLRGNGTPLNYAAGRHVLTLFCPGGPQFETIELLPDIVNAVNTKCL